MQNAFSSEFRRLDQIEIIDIKNENEIIDTWSGFCEPTNWHVKVYNPFFDSSLAEFPRRSIEGYWKRNYQGW